MDDIRELLPDYETAGMAPKLNKDGSKRKKPIQSCTDHCGGCNRHFHGLGAFDRHRADGYCEDPSTTVIRKRDGSETPALTIWTAEGFCDKTADCWDNGVRVKWNTPVIVWQVYQTEEARAKLKALSVSTTIFSHP